MTFVFICIGALILLGGVAALLSRGDDTPIQQGHDCSTCLSRDDGSCKIKCLLDEIDERREERLRVGERSSGTNGRWPKGKAMREERREVTSAMQSLYGEYNEQKLDINLDPLDDAYLVRITDETGKTVYEKAINAGAIVALNIDISSYAEGRYTVTVENSGESFTGIFDTNTTGIKENVTIERLKEDRIYNLQGQRMSSLRRGVNIVNGRKVYVK